MSEQAGSTNSKTQTYILTNENKSVTPGELSQSKVQVIERNNVDRVRREVDDLVGAVGNRVHYTHLKTVDNLVMLRVEIAVRLITTSSGRKLEQRGAKS